MLWQKACQALTQQMMILKDRLNICRFIFLTIFHANYNFLEPCCVQWSKPHMQRMAGCQCRWIFCSYWALDRGKHHQGVDWRKCIAWFHPAQHHSQWDQTWAGTVQGLQPSQYNTQGKYLSTVLCIYWLGIHVQIGHITCNNMKNNGTMLQEFTHCYNLKTRTTFDVKCRQIR